jgi:hypothetical protein
MDGTHGPKCERIVIQQLQPSNVVFQNFDTATKVSFRISGRVHARAGIQGIQKRIWIHASRVRSGHNVLERLKKGQVNARVSLASGEKAARARYRQFI